MLALTRSRRRARPSLPVMAAVVTVAFGALIAASVLAGRGNSTGGGTSDRATPAALKAYGDAIYPPTLEAGQAIEAGVRPDIEDFRAGRISPAVWEADMSARRREFTEAQRAFDRTRAPASVGDAPRWFDRAFADYYRAVDLFQAAGMAAGEQRDALILQGESAGQAGDRAFDQGTARIQAARRALGLAPDIRFSNAGER